MNMFAITSKGWVALQPVDDVVGPELSFGKTLQAKVPGNIAIAKFTHSGSQISQSFLAEYFYENGGGDTPTLICRQGAGIGPRGEVQTHYEPANQAMKRRDFLKVTGDAALGGLSITPASQAIEQRLAAKKAPSCGRGCACH
jgi:hypothetical protein